MSLFDIFTNKQQAPAQAPSQQQAPAPANPGNIPNQSSAVTGESQAAAPNGVLPAGGTKADDSPLANFKDLWDTKPTDPNAPAPSAPKELSAADVQKIVAKASFTGAVTPEMLSAISEGGETAQQAFVQAMNEVARQVMTQNTLVTDKMIQQKIAEALKQQEAALPEMLRKQSISAHSKDTNPIFSNPAVKPIIESTQHQLMQKFPNASPAEITKMTQEYIIAMGQEFAPKVTHDETKGDVDWSSFLK